MEYRIKILSLLVIAGMTSIFHGRTSFKSGMGNSAQELIVGNEEISPSLEWDSSPVSLSVKKRLSGFIIETTAYSFEPLPTILVWREYILFLPNFFYDVITINAP